MTPPLLCGVEIFAVITTVTSVVTLMELLELMESGIKEDVEHAGVIVTFLFVTFNFELGNCRARNPRKTRVRLSGGLVLQWTISTVQT